jgi:hypothetical protein
VAAEADGHSLLTLPGPWLFCRLRLSKQVLSRERQSLFRQPLSTKGSLLRIPFEKLPSPFHNEGMV